jgi:hypothetical protein
MIKVPLSAFGISPQRGERFSWDRVVVFVSIFRSLQAQLGSF